MSKIGLCEVPSFAGIGRAAWREVMAMLRWLFVALLAVQVHFTASYLIPLDEQAQETFGGLLRWAWPWAIGDRGPLGPMIPSALPLPGLLLALTSAGILTLAALAALRIWIPFEWWGILAVAGALSSLPLMVLFFGLTKLLPIVTALLILAAGLGYWSPMAGR